MATPIQRLAKLSSKILTGQSAETITKETLSPIIHLLNEIKADDINFCAEEIIARDASLKTTGRAAPVTFMNLCQNENFTMAVFVVKTGSSLPLHDHPRMFGLLKVITGSVEILSYSKVDQEALSECREEKPSMTTCTDTDIETRTHWSGTFPEIFAVKRNSNVILSSQDDCCFLSPDEGNFHEIKPLTNVAAFLDILTPPYSDDRDCRYYKECPNKTPYQDNIRWLKEVPQPVSYWCDVLKYKGPSLTFLHSNH